MASGRDARPGRPATDSCFRARRASPRTAPRRPAGPAEAPARRHTGCSLGTDVFEEGEGGEVIYEGVDIFGGPARRCCQLSAARRTPCMLRHDAAAGRSGTGEDVVSSPPATVGPVAQPGSTAAGAGPASSSGLDRARSRRRAAAAAHHRLTFAASSVAGEWTLFHQHPPVRPASSASLAAGTAGAAQKPRHRPPGVPPRHLPARARRRRSAILRSAVHFELKPVTAGTRSLIHYQHLDDGQQLTYDRRPQPRWRDAGATVSAVRVAPDGDAPPRQQRLFRPDRPAEHRSAYRSSMEPAELCATLGPASCGRRARASAGRRHWPRRVRVASTGLDRARTNGVNASAAAAAAPDYSRGWTR